MAEKISGEAIVLSLETTQAVSNAKKLEAALVSAGGTMDSVSLAMIARISQFDKALEKWGKQADKGSLSASVEAETSRVIRALEEAQRDIEKISSTGIPAGINQMIATRQTMAANIGTQSANLQGKGGIWSSDSTPGLLPAQTTFTEADRARAAAVAANAHNTRVSKQRDLTQLLTSGALSSSGQNTLSSELGANAYDRNVYGLGGIAPSPNHNFAAQLQASMEAANIPRLQRERTEEANRYNSVQRGIREREVLDGQRNAPPDTAIRERMEQQERERIQQQRPYDSALEANRINSIQEGIREREALDAKRNAPPDTTIRERMEQQAAEQMQQQHIYDSALEANRHNATQVFAAKAQNPFPNTAGSEFSYNLALRMQEENAERIQQQRKQITTSSNIRGMSGEGLFGKADQLRSLRDSLGTESGLGRDVTTELAQVQNALDGVSVAIRRANSEQLELKLGGIREHIRDMRQLRAEFAYSDRERQVIDRELVETNIVGRAQGQRAAADQKRAAGTLSPEDHDVEMRRIDREEKDARSALSVDNFLGDREHSATNVTGIRSAGISELRNKNSDINALAARGEGSNLPAALAEIQNRIERINATELRLRIGGNPKQRLAAIDQELRYTLGEEPRAALQQDRAKIVREQGLQKHFQRLDAQHVSGALGVDDYNRRRQQAQERFDNNEERLRQQQRGEEWNSGAIDPQTGKRNQSRRVPGQGGHNDRKSFGNDDGARLYAYRMQNIAFGIDDAIQSSQYGGLQGAIRGASNNLTAILSTAFTNPMVAAATVVGASFGAMLVPYLVDTGKEAKNVADQIRSIVDELGRMQNFRTAKLDLNLGTSGSDPKESRQKEIDLKRKREALEVEREEITKQIRAQGDIGPAGATDSPLHNIDAWSEGLNRFIHDTFSSESHSKEEWYTKRVKELQESGQMRVDAASNDPVHPNSRSTLGEEELAQADRMRIQLEEMKRDRARTVLGAESGVKGLLDQRTTVDAKLRDLHLEEKEQQQIRDRIAAQEAFHSSSLLNARSSSSAIRSYTRQQETSLSPEDPTAFLVDIRDREREELKERFSNLIMSTTGAGGDTSAIELQFEQELNTFDEQWKSTLHDKVEAAKDALEAFERAENPYLSDSIRDFFGKSKNSSHLAESGIGNLADPTLRMHKQEQQYWEQVRQDEALAKGMKNSIRGALDPTRNAEETLKQKFEEIDDMKIDLYEKSILKEGLTTQSQNELRRQNVVRNTNTGVESGSMRSLELQQLNLQASNPVVTAIDKVVQEQRATRKAIENARNLKTATIYRMI